MGDNPEEEKETYEEAAVEPEEAQEAPEAEEPPEPPEPKVKPKAKPKAVAKPGKNDKVECADCGKTMNANTLRYKHVCKPPKSTEIQKEKPRKKVKQAEQSDEEPVREPRKKREAYSPSTPRTKMLHYYREARIAQQEQKQARYRSWLGND